LRALAQWSGDSEDDWDLKIKALCGSSLLNREKIYLGAGNSVSRLTIVGVGKTKMTSFIENILAKSIEMSWPVVPPEKEQ
jgi:hypothetical protein